MPKSTNHPATVHATGAVSRNPATEALTATYPSASAAVRRLAILPRSSGMVVQPHKSRYALAHQTWGWAMRARLLGWAILVAGMTPSLAQAQATTRQCGAVEDAGPACLLARQPLAHLPKGKIYWHIDRFPSRDLAERARLPASSLVDAFGSTWLFTLAKAGWRSQGGEHLSRIGPLPVAPAASYTAEYLRSIFTPGTTAPLHVHSGPEAFYAVSGDTCLETPEGIQTGRGPGNSLMIKAGPPMLLMAIGKVPRRGFALILHDASQPPTTLTQAWQPGGLCARQLSLDQMP